MYRHNIPRFMVPPAGIRGHHPGPPPPQSIALRMQGNFHQEVPYNQRNETHQSNPPQIPVPPPAVKDTSPSINKWRSSFTTVGEDDKDNNNNSSSRSGTDDNKGTEDVHPPERSTDTTLEKGKRVRTRTRTRMRVRKRLRMMAHGEDNTSSQLYDPYEAVMSDSDDNPSLAPQKDLQDSRGRWDIEANIERRRLSPAPPLFPSRDTDSTERTRYSIAGDHRASDYRTEVGLSPPPPLPHNYKQSPGFTTLDQLPPSRQEIKEPGKTEEITDKNLISCDLCEVELSNGQELEEHLDSKCHWDTLEYIQKNNNYDDMAIAFLQDVMTYKSRKCSRAIEDTALQALQEYDHMTKVEMFHCAACNLFISTSALAVQNHITTQLHMANTKVFQVQQRRSCLDKANTMMKELTPQFQSFVKGMSPFE